MSRCGDGGTVSPVAEYADQKHARIAEELLDRGFTDENNVMPTDVQIAIALKAICHALLAIYIGGAG